MSNSKLLSLKKTLLDWIERSQGKQESILNGYKSNPERKTDAMEMYNMEMAHYRNVICEIDRLIETGEENE